MTGEYMELEGEFRTITAPDGSIGVTNVPVTFEATLTPHGAQVLGAISRNVIEATMHDAGIDEVPGPCETCRATESAALQALRAIIHETAIHENGRWTLKPFGTPALERGAALLVQHGLAEDAGRCWYRWTDQAARND